MTTIGGTRYHTLRHSWIGECSACAQLYTIRAETAEAMARAKLDARSACHRAELVERTV